MNIDLNIIEKYNVPVPRYTSYPPANHFTDEITSGDFLELISASNSWEPQHMAFYVHIPFCKKICFYCGCNACRLNGTQEVRDYLEALKKEIIHVAGQLDRSRKVTQLHFGGGTPNAIPAEMLAEITALFNREFTFSDDAEIAIETNPATLDLPYMEKLVSAGFNRFSFGIQDFNEEVLKMVNREPSAIPVPELVKLVKSLNDRAAVNLDFIYGLPGQSPESFSSSMEKAAEADPDRLVTFSYAHVPWLKKHQQILEKRGLPGPEEKTRMFLAGYDVLTAVGYEPVGLDHFVKREDELFRALEQKKLHRNFQGYCTRETTGQVYAFGVSAISQLEKAYVQNTKEIEKYTTEIGHGRLPVEKGKYLSDDQLMIREVITRLMCNKQLEWKTIADELGTGEETLKQLVGFDPGKFSEMEKDNLLEVSCEGLHVTERGSMMIRNIAAALDPAYKQQVNKYSKSV